MLGIVAGGGTLPAIVAEAARAGGRATVIARIGDGIPLDYPGIETAGFPWGRTGDAIDWLKRHDVRSLVFCGTVSSRPDFKSLVPSWRTLRRLPAAFSIVRGGDDRLLRNLTAYLEREGFVLVPVQDIAPSLLTPVGCLTQRAPDPREIQALALAERAAVALGELDAGQAAVASQERVVALEGVEGTSRMIARVSELRRFGKFSRSERLVLVKSVKPAQDRRFDLPSIGIKTVEEAKDAGISAIGISAGESLIIGLDDVLDAANEAGLAIYGMPAAKLTSPKASAEALR